MNEEQRKKFADKVRERTIANAIFGKRETPLSDEPQWFTESTPHSDREDSERYANAEARVAGMPFIRDGDKVFIIGKMPTIQDTMRESMERMSLSFDEYECPFDFMTEFDQWFAWRRRVYFDKWSTGRTITSMLSDVERIKRHKIERRLPIRVTSDYGASLKNWRNVILNTV